MLNTLASLFEPNLIIIPYLEFKCALTIFSSDSDEVSVFIYYYFIFLIDNIFKTKKANGII